MRTKRCFVFLVILYKIFLDYLAVLPYTVRVFRKIEMKGDEQVIVPMDVDLKQYLAKYKETYKHVMKFYNELVQILQKNQQQRHPPVSLSLPSDFLSAVSPHPSAR